MCVKEYLSSATTTMCQRVFTRRLLYNLLFLLVMSTYLTNNVDGTFASELFRLVAEGTVDVYVILFKTSHRYRAQAYI